MQINLLRSAGNQLAVIGLLFGVSLFSITATHETTAQPGRASAEAAVVQANVGTPGGVFGWD